MLYSKLRILITALLIIRQEFLLWAMKFENKMKQQQKQHKRGFLKDFAFIDFSMSLPPAQTIHF